MEILDEFSLNEILEYKFEELLDNFSKARSDNHNLYNIILEIFEKELLKKTFEKANFNQRKASEMLGINRNTLKKKLVKYNLI